MDLLDIQKLDKSEVGAVMYLTHPMTGKRLEHDGKQMFIRLTGMYSRAYRENQHRWQNEQLMKSARGMEAHTIRNDEDGADLLADCTVDWFIVVGGEQPACTKEAAKKLYLEHRWIKDQVDAFAGNNANFFGVA